MDIDKKTKNYIEKMAKELSGFDNSTLIYCNIEYFIKFLNKEDKNDIFITINEGPIRDLDFLFITNAENTRDFHTLKNRLKYLIISLLLEKDIIPQFCVSDDLIEEKGNWINIKVAQYFPVLSSHKIKNYIAEGLKKLSDKFDEILKMHNSLNLSDYKECKSDIDKIYLYYQKENDFNSSNSVKSLQFLKAAAVCKIILFEQEKRNQKITKIINEIDKEIFDIAIQLHDHPFFLIKVPDFIQSIKEFYSAHPGTTEELPIVKTIDINNPSVTIENPIKDEFVAHSVPMKGTIGKLPNGMEVWIVKEIHKRYHPDQGPIYIQGDRWWGTAYVGNSTPGTDTNISFLIHLVLTTHEIGQKYKDYIEKAASSGWIGIDDLLGAKKLESVRVIRNDVMVQSNKLTVSLHEYLKNHKATGSDGKTIDLYERLKEIKEKAQEWLKDYGKNGYKHSERLEEYLNKLVLSQGDGPEKLTPGETFVLLCAAYMHDIGYMVDGKREATGHPERSQDRIIRNPNKYLLGDFPSFAGSTPRVAEAVGLVCFGHSDENHLRLQKMSNEFPDQALSNQPLNLRKLTALLRLADEADDPYFRPGSQHASSIRDNILLVAIGTETIVWHWQASGAMEPNEFIELKNQKNIVLKTSIEYLREIGAGTWYIVLEPPVTEKASFFGKLPIKQKWSEKNKLVNSAWWQSSEVRKQYEAKDYTDFAWANSDRVAELVSKGMEIVYEIDEENGVKNKLANKSGQVLVARKLEVGEEKTKYRRELIASWRKMVQDIIQLKDHSESSDVELLERHEAFFSLKPHLSQKTIREIARVRTIIAGSTIGAPLEFILEDIARIEKDWHLI